MSARVGAAVLGAWCLLTGCKKSEAEVVSNAASAYAGPSGRLIVFNATSAHAPDTAPDTADTAPSDTADTAPAPPGLSLTIDDANWNLTLSSGEGVALPWSVADGLLVDDTQLLPATVTAGASTGSVEVTEKGERTVWYGTFPDVASVTVSSGSLAGEWAFARDVGPIYAHVGGGDWELVYYQ